MTSPAGVRQVLLGEKLPYRRMRLFAALLSTESGLGVSGLAVVGGSAIEIYTSGDYVSGDIDLLVSDRRPAERLLKLWGFRDEGKLWTNSELRLYVDLMQAEPSGSKRLTRILQTKFGPIRLAAIEDLILKRLLEARYWAQRPALAQAMLLSRMYWDGLDHGYIDFVAKRDRIVDLVDQLERDYQKHRKK